MKIYARERLFQALVGSLAVVLIGACGNTKSANDPSAVTSKADESCGKWPWAIAISGVPAEDRADTPEGAVRAVAPAGVTIVGATFANSEGDVEVLLDGRSGSYHVVRSNGMWGVVGGEGCAAGSEPSRQCPTQSPAPADADYLLSCVVPDDTASSQN